MVQPNGFSMVKMGDILKVQSDGGMKLRQKRSEKYLRFTVGCLLGRRMDDGFKQYGKPETGSV